MQGNLRGNSLHVDTGMFLVRIELKPISTKVDLARELGLKALHGFNRAGGSFLDPLLSVNTPCRARYVFTRSLLQNG